MKTLICIPCLLTGGTTFRSQSLVEVEKYSFERYAELIHNLW